VALTSTNVGDPVAGRRDVAVPDRTARSPRVVAHRVRGCRRQRAALFGSPVMAAAKVRATVIGVPILSPRFGGRRSSVCGISAEDGGGALAYPPLPR
jgi:hypothetical protein